MGATLVAASPLSDDITAFTFAAEEPVFAECDAGAHVDVHLPGGIVRSYSLTDWDFAGRWGRVAVKREDAGRGGSLAMHALELGAVVEISRPRNHFRIEPSSEPAVLVAGGIGITPLYAIATALQGAGRPFELHYLVRTRGMAAFDAMLRELGLGERYHLHCDDVDGLFDVSGLVRGLDRETCVYVCGPEVLLSAILDASRESVRGRILYERFGLAASGTAELGEAFTIELAFSGEQLAVPGDRSILQVLLDAGHDMAYSCGEGECGSCITDVLDGDIEHRDSYLTDEERAAGDCMCICVSRSRGPLIVLDL